MFTLILSAIFAALAALAWVSWPRRRPPEPGAVLDPAEAPRRALLSRLDRRLVAGALGAVSLVLFATLHFITPAGREIVVLDKVFGVESLSEGRLIATDGERGLQAEILKPGFQLKPFINLFYNTRRVPYVEVPQGSYGLVSAKDGLPLKDGAVVAPPVPVELFLDAKAFMDGAEIAQEDWRGFRGTQTTILRPGAYPINTHLFDVEIVGTEATVVPNGYVAVIKSAVDEGFRPDFMKVDAGATANCTLKEERTVGTVSVELVPVGCRGTWQEALPPGTYFLNRLAYEVTLIETRTTTLTYRGGYPSARIDLDIGDDGSVTQRRTAVEVPADQSAAGNAIKVIVEGWPVYQDVRVQLQISPEDAPATVAAIGGLDQVRDRFITPDLRSIVRTLGGGAITVTNKLEYDAAVAEIEALKARIELLRTSDSEREGEAQDVAAEIARLSQALAQAEADLPEQNATITRPTLVLDFVENRAVLETEAARLMTEAGRNAGARIVGVKFGNADIPPELLVARKREQLADQYRRATLQEQLGQRARIATERERATADQQSELVQAQIAVQTSELGIERRTNDGRAEEAYLTALARGEQERVDVIGQDRVAQLRIVEAVLAALQQTPELVTGIQLPRTVVAGGGDDGGLAAFGALLKSSRLFGGEAEEPAAPAR